LKLTDLDALARHPVHVELIIISILALVGALQHRLPVRLQRRLEDVDQLHGGVVRRRRRDDGLPEVALLRSDDLGRPGLEVGVVELVVDGEAEEAVEGRVAPVEVDDQVDL